MTDTLTSFHAAVRELANGRHFSTERALRDGMAGATERWGATIHERHGCRVLAGAYEHETPGACLAALALEMAGATEGEAAHA